MRRVAADYQKTNRVRCARWHKGKRRWLPPELSNALAGEVGELCNAVKKLQRLRDGIDSRRHENVSELALLEQIAKEIGDSYAYLDMLADDLGLNTWACIVSRFNQVSKEAGFKDRVKL